MFDLSHPNGGNFYDEYKAEKEAGGLAHQTQIINRDILTLDSEGKEYWDKAFKRTSEKAPPVLIRGLLPLWFAEAHGFDGVWWDEEHNVSKNSAPRGAIFQSTLEDWSYEQTGTV